MGTAILTFDEAIPPVWKLAATGAVTVIISSLNGPGTYFHNTANVVPTTNFGHPIKEGESLTFNVKAGEFLFVRPDNAATKIVVTT